MPHRLLIALIFLAFISLGLPDALLGVGWPAMRRDMAQPLEAVGMVTIVLTISAVISAQFSARLAQHWGTGVVVAASALTTALALVGMALAPSFAWLVLLAVPLGLGGGAVDASLNHFVAQHYSARHMNWLHGCWGIGATAGPLIISTALATQGGWRAGTGVLAALQVSLAVLLWSSLRLWGNAGAQANTPTDATSAHPAAAAPRRLASWLSPLIFLVYVSAEIGTGLWAASILFEGRGVALKDAGIAVSCYFGAITVGRFAIGSLANRIGSRRLIRFGIAGATLGACLFALPAAPAWLWFVGLMLMGLGCAPIFPSMMHETAARFAPELAQRVIARNMSFSYAGGSITPAALGVLAAWAGLHWVMPVVLVLLLALAAGTEWLNRLTPVSRR
jgi:MFS family permease